MPDVILLYL